MQAICIEHPTEEVLERYLFGHASAHEFDEVEPHLLVCDGCMDRVEEIRDFQTALRDGFALFKEERVEEAQPESPSLFVRILSGPGSLKWLTAGRVPRWTFVPAMAALLLGILLVPHVRKPSDAPVDVSVSALRGDETGTRVPVGRKVQFHLNLDGLATSPVSVQVVDGDGWPVGPMQRVTVAGHPIVEFPAFASGTYLIRVYATNDGYADQDKLLREFSFQAK